MSRVQFVETVTIPNSVGGALMPLAGVGATPYVVNTAGIEGGQANAYAGRIGTTAASSLVTDASGTVSYWLDAGDYNVHVSDQQSPKRIQDYTRGFTAPVIDTNALVVAAQNLIQFTGDTKFSMQTADHGLKADGSFEWLLVSSDPDGGGRQVDGAIYSTLRQIMGNPPLTAGKFRLPNISGRALIASGAASGLTARNLLDMFGTEVHSHPIGSLPIPTMGFTASNAGAIGVAVSVAAHYHPLSSNGFAAIGLGSAGANTAIEVGALSGSFGAQFRWYDDRGWAFDTPGGIGPYQGIALGGTTDNATPGASGSIGAGGVGVNGSISGAATSSGQSTGNGSSFQPSAGMNLFVKT